MRPAAVILSPFVATLVSSFGNPSEQSLAVYPELVSGHPCTPSIFSVIHQSENSTNILLQANENKIYHHLRIGYHLTSIRSAFSQPGGGGYCTGKVYDKVLGKYSKQFLGPSGIKAIADAFSNACVMPNGTKIARRCVTDEAKKYPKAKSVASAWLNTFPFIEEGNGSSIPPVLATWSS
jgi:hypothetical protein